MLGTKPCNCANCLHLPCVHMMSDTPRLSRRARTALFKAVYSTDKRMKVSPRRYSRLAGSVYNAVGIWDVKAFKHPPNPVAPIHVDPASVRYITGRDWPAWKNRRLLIGTVRSGDWDISEPGNVPEEEQPYPRLFEEYAIHKAFSERFVDGAAWEDSARYGRQIDAASARGAEALKRIREKLSGYDRLYNTIKTHGYKSQLEIGGESYLSCVSQEVAVDIGRDGEILFVDGRHRLSIAKLLGIKKIPAFVLVRHHEWMENRDAMVSTGEGLDHPDLPDQR